MQNILVTAEKWPWICRRRRLYKEQSLEVRQFNFNLVQSELVKLPDGDILDIYLDRWFLRISSYFTA